MGTPLTTILIPLCVSVVLGIRVKIILSWDPSGKTGPKKPLSDHMNIVDSKDEILSTISILGQKDRKPELPAMLEPVPTA